MLSAMLYNPFGQSGGSSPSVVSLDPPVESSISSDTYHAYGFDRMVEGFSGDTVRLKRLSDNAESDFGFQQVNLIWLLLILGGLVLMLMWYILKIKWKHF